MCNYDRLVRVARFNSEWAVAMNTEPYEVAVTVLNGSVFIGSDHCQWITSNHEQLLSF